MEYKLKKFHNFHLKVSKLTIFISAEILLKTQKHEFEKVSS
jgi:hypothetical protein